MRASDSALDEAAARRVLLVQAFETGTTDEPQWTAADRAWATRLAREEGAAATPAQFLHRRAHHALQRLAPRDAGVQRLLARKGWNWRWLLLALLLGGVCGVLADSIGSSQRVNLMAPPVWAVVLWNLLVYVALLLMHLSMSMPMPMHLPGLAALGAARRWLVRRLAAAAAPGGAAGTPLQRFHVLWLRLAEPLMRARAATLMHTTAAALALGLIGGLYLRGLVLDYRAGWQSTFLDATQVHVTLSWVMQPAARLTGIAVPDVAALQALRWGADGVSTSVPATAAPWIHLYAATLFLLVLLPRSVLALWAGARAARQSRRLLLPLDEPYAARLLREQQGHDTRVQVLPQGRAPTPHALACLQAVLAPVLGSGLKLDLAPATAYGDEEAAAGLRPAPGCSLRLLLVDLASTPEPDTHGAFARALRKATPAVPLLVLADESAFRSRFATLPARVAERRAAWLQWAQAEGLAWVGIDLAQPDPAAAERALNLALQLDAAR